MYAQAEVLIVQLQIPLHVVQVLDDYPNTTETTFLTVLALQKQGDLNEIRYLFIYLTALLQVFIFYLNIVGMQYHIASVSGAYRIEWTIL